MKKIVFTICSNNYLAQAKVLGDSLLDFNNDYQFIIALCDKKSSQIDYSLFNRFEIIEMDALEIPKIDDMVKRYEITELNTAIKPFVFNYIYKHYDSDYVYYMDPDIAVYDKLTYIEEQLVKNNFVLTPHILHPVKTDNYPCLENDLTQTGIFNLGFLATKRCEEVNKMLSWWMQRLEVGCYIRVHKGTFVDQLPMVHLPVFFDGVCISKNMGLNVAHWNLAERELCFRDGKYYINDNFPLIFFHFSGYSPFSPHLVTKRWKDVFLDEKTPILKILHDEYREKLLNNNYKTLFKIKCFYIKNRKIELILKFIRKYAFKTMLIMDKLIVKMREI